MGKGILVGGQKGGTGKSMLACNLAVMYASQGFDVLLVDCDFQKTSYKFWKRRGQPNFEWNRNEENNGFDCIVERQSDFNFNEFSSSLFQHSLNYDIFIVDVGGQDSKFLRAAMVSDSINLLLSTIQPSFSDIETLVFLDDLVKDAKKLNTNIDTYCVVNRCHYNQNVSSKKSAINFVDKHCKFLNSLNQTLTDLVAYKHAFAKGKSVIEFELEKGVRKRCSAEMQLLYKEISGNNYRIE